MRRHLNTFILTAVGILIIALGLLIYPYIVPFKKAVPINTNTTENIVSDRNELLVLHIGQLVTSSKTGLELTLTKQNSIHTSVGDIEFTVAGETKTVGQYNIRLVSSTATAAQVLVMAVE
ncbi:MAG: hypothetical protein WCV88_04065 [Patescibacteria group bacterium]|jgi:hypothetical protein